MWEIVICTVQGLTGEITEKHMHSILIRTLQPCKNNNNKQILRYYSLKHPFEPYLPSGRSGLLSQRSSRPRIPLIGRKTFTRQPPPFFFPFPCCFRTSSLDGFFASGPPSDETQILQLHYIIGTCTSSIGSLHVVGCGSITVWNWGLRHHNWMDASHRTRASQPHALTYTEKVKDGWIVGHGRN